MNKNKNMSNPIMKVFHFLTDNMNRRTMTAVILGTIIMGLGEALLRTSGMGNDPFTAFTLATSARLGVGLGNFQLCFNAFLLIIELIFGRKYIGFGSIMNLAVLGYVVQGWLWVIEKIVGKSFTSSLSLPVAIVFMLIALIILSFGLSMYQDAELGVSPFDFLALGMKERFPKKPYFMFRIMFDGALVLILFIFVLTGFMKFEDSNLGLGTVFCALCLGPFINLCSVFNKKWIQPGSHGRSQV